MILVDKPEYTLTVEWLWFGAIMHNTVHRWNKTTLKSIREDLQRFALICGVPVYAFQCETHDPLKRKYIRKMGFVFDHYRCTDEGERAEMYRLHPLNIQWRNNG